MHNNPAFFPADPLRDGFKRLYPDSLRELVFAAKDRTGRLVKFSGSNSKEEVKPHLIISYRGKNWTVTLEDIKNNDYPNGVEQLFQEMGGQQSDNLTKDEEIIEVKMVDNSSAGGEEKLSKYFQFLNLTSQSTQPLNGFSQNSGLTLFLYTNTDDERAEETVVTLEGYCDKLIQQRNGKVILALTIKKAVIKKIGQKQVIEEVDLLSKPPQTIELEVTKHGMELVFPFTGITDKFLQNLFRKPLYLNEQIEMELLNAHAINAEKRADNQLAESVSKVLSEMTELYNANKEGQRNTLKRGKFFQVSKLFNIALSHLKFNNETKRDDDIDEPDDDAVIEKIISAIETLSDETNIDLTFIKDYCTQLADNLLDKLLEKQKKILLGKIK